MRLRSSLVVLLVLCPLGCKKPPPPPPPVTVDANEVNALVPEALKRELSFATRRLSVSSFQGDAVFTVALPSSWVEDKTVVLPGTAVASPPPVVFGNLTSFKVSRGCGGACEPKDWASTARGEFATFGSDVTTVRDEVTQTSALRLTTNEDTTWLEFAWWYPGAAQYFRCSVTLQRGSMPGAGDPRPALAAFEKTCRMINVDLANKESTSPL